MTIATVQAVPLEEAIQKRLEELEAERERLKPERAKALKRQNELQGIARQWAIEQIAEHEGVALPADKLQLRAYSDNDGASYSFDVTLSEGGVIIELQGMVDVVPDKIPTWRWLLDLWGRERVWQWGVTWDDGDNYHHYGSLVDAVLTARGVEVNL